MTRQSYSLPDDLPPTGGFAPFSEPSIRQVANFTSLLANFLRGVTTSLRNAIEGKLNCVGDVTLAVSAATTTLSDRRIGSDSCILFMPTTANAAVDVGAGTFYVSARTDGSATLTHANNANVDRTFTYAVFG